MLPAHRITFRNDAFYKISRSATRLASTITGQSGRVYVQGEVLQRRKDPRMNIYKAQCGNESFVYKCVPPSYYELSQRIAGEFAGCSPGLRMHVDGNKDGGILVYPFYKTTLLMLLQDDPDFPLAQRKKILQCVGKAIQELHGKDWAHVDIKPDNILVNWHCDTDGSKVVTDVALGDFDLAFKSVNGEPRPSPYAVGNAMWRSIEGHTGRGVTKASDIYSFGLVCIYAFGGGELLLIDNWSELVKRGISAEQAIVTRHFTYFGRPTEGLLKRIDNENWSAAFKKSSEVADMAIKDQPQLGFDQWGQEVGLAGHDMISGMTRIDPAARLSIEEVLAHRWWLEDVDLDGQAGDGPS